jgi:arylsulfatase A-like enzyme
MTRREFTSIIAGAMTLGAAPQDAARPNIVAVMADDMGFSDLGCYGGEVRTPNLDRLASNGVRFRQFYNTARCCPTRASLLTGLYPHQAGVGHMMADNGLPGYRGDLNGQCVTIAEVLRTAGYRTLMSGKWHVTPASLPSKHNWPLQRGFDRFYGTIHGAGSFYDPVTLAEGNEFIKPEGRDYYYTDALSHRAAQWINEFAGKPEPFFLYLPYTAPHWPLHALEEDIRRYENQYKQGWDALRKERLDRMVELGIVDRRWRLTDRDPAVPPWEEAPNKPWEARRMAVYAAMIDRMDQGIGQVISALERSGALDNTLILFLADNGGCAEELSTSWKGLHIPVKTRDGRAVQLGNDPEVMPGPETTYQSYGIPWANASNTPFRLYKHWVHEGGISTPLIAHWPAAIRQAGRQTDEPGHVIDLMATCVDVAGAKYPTTREGKAVAPMEGRSLLPVLQGRRGGPERDLYWEHEGNRAIRRGRWKLVSRHGQPWELYDLAADRTETNDLAARRPGTVRDLGARYDAWAKRAYVAPWPLPQPIRQGD